jgi:hypothetical protein
VRLGTTARSISAVGGALALVCAAAATAHAAAWTVANPPYSVLSNVPYAPLASVSASSAGNAWAVGRDDGSVLTEHWSGGKWTAVGIPAGPCDVFESSCQLTGVSVDPSGGAIAVGNAVLNDNGWLPAALAYQWSGGAWHAMPVAPSIPYMSLGHVKAFTPTNAWAVGSGASGTSSTPVVTHWDGTAWTQSATPYTTTLSITMNAIAGDAPTDLWIAGTAQSSGYRNRVVHSVLEHFDGTAWSTVAVPDDAGLLDVAPLSSTDVWALAADGTVLNYNGAAWSAAAKFNGGAALAAASPTSVYVGGVYVNSTLAVAHYNGTAWTTTTAPSGIGQILSGAAVSSGPAWFAGLQWPSNGSTIPAVLSTTG